MANGKPRYDPDALARLLSIAVSVFTIGFGAVLTVKEWKPFWLDEWRIIFNLKFRSVPCLWGQLDYMQQAPRVYLSIIKVFTAAFDYRYTALRLPSFVVGTALILFAWRLARRIYPEATPLKYLLVLLPVCSLTFSGYYVQVKQYTMDMLISLAAIWQLLELLRLGKGDLSSRRYSVLCMAGFILPFFSYTYPIVIAPAYAISAVRALRNKDAAMRRRLGILLLFAVAGIGIFYLVDVRQLMADGGMIMFWGHLMLRDGYSWQGVSVAPDLFQKILTPSPFNIAIGYLTLAAYLLRLGMLLSGRWRSGEPRVILEYYSVLLLSGMITLFFAGKLPLGEARLNAFAIPAMAILLISLLREGYTRYSGWPASVAALLLLAGVAAAGIYAQTAPFREEHYHRKLAVYQATQNALKEADRNHLPILITPEVAFPWHESRNFPFYDPIPGDWVLKTLPAYHVHSGLPVVNIQKMEEADSVLATLQYAEAMAGDGQHYRVLRK